MREDLSRKRRSMKILSSVPCGGAYHTCQFIRDAANMATTIAADDAALERLEASAPPPPPQLSADRDVAALRAELKRADVVSATLVERERLEGNRRAAMLELESIGKCDVRCDVDDRIVAATRMIAVVDRDITAARRDHDRAATALERAEIDRARKMELVAEVGDLEKLVAAMSRRGVPLALLRQHLSEINERVAELLEQSAGMTARALVDGDELQIEVSSQRGTVPIELACGMEKFFTALAFRMVMAKLSPSSADFFVIDEGFGALDDLNVDAACRLLSIAKCMFSFVIIISHVDAIKDVADHLLEIVRDDEGRSRIIQR